jgi:hypothetical protein
MLRRSPDPVSLICGLAFAGLGLTLLVGHGDLRLHPRWVWPGVLIVLAIALLPGLRPERDHAGDPPPPSPPPAAPAAPDSGAGGAGEGL